MTASVSLKKTIDHELSWREAELAILKINLQKSSTNMVEFRISYRSFLAMTYAHYEGYTKRLLAQGLEDIHLSGVPIHKCVVGIHKTAALPEVRRKLNSMSSESLYEHLLKGILVFDEVNLPNPDAILDRGNLDIPTITWAMALIGVNFDNFVEHRQSIARLTHLRHKCAHGEVITLDPLKTVPDILKDCYSLQDNIILFMHKLAVYLLDYFDQKQYVAN
ncbi:MAE_28990/MAE_18760 family HEPN-like nuclease [Sphingomonas sp. 1P06PA]|uniref:MAE_28990/MAE_18760 family HEPN-like nuclease n=1 Tax=Sphingomonas sp. 1P06PA TaxID=554121 RepID=UPI0039A705EE